MAWIHWPACVSRLPLGVIFAIVWLQHGRDGALGGGPLWRGCRLGGEVVAAISGDGQCSGQDAGAKPRGGKKAYVVVGLREWLLAQIAGSPNLTLRAMVEPADGTRLQVVKFLSFFLV